MLLLLLGNDRARTHFDDSARACGQCGIMRDQHERRPGLTVQPEKHLDDRLACLSIEVAGRFVGEKDFRAMNEGTGERDALLFTARKLGRVMAEPIRESYLREQFHGFFMATGMAAQFERDEHIFDRGERRDKLEILKDEPDEAVAQGGPGVLIEVFERLAIKPHAARGGIVEPGAEAEQRGFAAARRAGDRAGVSGKEREVDVAQDGQLAPVARKTFAQTSDFEDGRFDNFQVVSDAGYPCGLIRNR